MINDSIYVQFITRTIKKQSAGRVSENIEVPIVHGAKNALGLSAFPKPKRECTEQTV